MERVEVPLIKVVFDIFEKLILGRDLMVSFDVVDHLNEVVRNSFEIYLTRDWGPPEVEVVDLGVLELNPER
jgi:hypothetical protein